MNPQDIIRHKRDGGELPRAEIEFFARGVVTGEFADYQAAALLMAIYWRGMTEAEQAALTQAMLRSGALLDFADIDKPKADKHSTGGVGDKTSLLIAPIVAACDVCVPMLRSTSRSASRSASQASCSRSSASSPERRA